MASFMYAFLSLANAASMHCSIRPEISPCTCESLSSREMAVYCEKIDSFHQIVDVLSKKLPTDTRVQLKITHSQLEDLEMRLFKDITVNLVKLRLQWNKLRSVPELPFRGLDKVGFLSFSDNLLEEVPKHALNHMPLLQTLDMARCQINAVLQDDFKGIQNVTYLFLPDNNITRLDKGAFPHSIVTLHLGRNQIETLNGTIKDLPLLESLFINTNNLTTLEGELPEHKKLKLILAHNNRLENLPQSMKHMALLETVHFQYNNLKSFDLSFQNASFLTEVYAFNNQIEFLAQDEFAQCKSLESLDMRDNKLKMLNSSLLPLIKLRTANFSSNEIREFALHEISGLKSLTEFDLSKNQIEILTGHYQGKTALLALKLNHNRITSLNDSLVGLYNLKHLYLSHNKIERIFPYNFEGLQNLETLDLSHNILITLADMEHAFLPKMSTLMLQYNNLTSLERDFYGLPFLCFVNITNNQITSISEKLVQHTHCEKHGVQDTLQIHLDDNPIMCDERLMKLCNKLEKEQARIRGRSQCYESDQEVCTILRMLFKPPIDEYVIMPNDKIIFKPMTPLKSKLPPIIATMTTTTFRPTIPTTTTTLASIITLHETPSNVLDSSNEKILNKDQAQDANNVVPTIMENDNINKIPLNIDQSPVNSTNLINGMLEGQQIESLDINNNNTQSTANVIENTNANIISEMPPNFIKIEDSAIAANLPNSGNSTIFANDEVNDHAGLAPTMTQKEYIAIEYIPNDDFNSANPQPHEGPDEADAKTNFVEVSSHLGNSPQSLLPNPAEPPENL